MPNWKPLERAMQLVGRPLSDCGSFMFMLESPAGTFQYKHRDTRNYAMLRADSTGGECAAELERAEHASPTWGNMLIMPGRIER